MIFDKIQRRIVRREDFLLEDMNKRNEMEFRKQREDNRMQMKEREDRSSWRMGMGK